MNDSKQEPEPIYIVAGHPRSGTSAMMRALESGGMTSIWGEERNARFEKFKGGEYKPNPHGFYEPSKLQLNHLMDPEQCHDFAGSCVKLIIGQLLPLPVFKYRVVLMTRDPEEIRLSWERFFNASRDVFRGGADYHDPKFLNKYWETIGRCERQLSNRRDVWSVYRVDYRRLIHDPLETFVALGADWPINAADAAAVIDKDLYRARCLSEQKSQ